MKSIKSTTILVILITFLSKVSGFLREIALSYVHGAGDVSDAYILSMSIPYIVFGVITAGVVTGFIPVYTRAFHNEGEIEANKFLSTLINIIILVSAFFLGFVLIFTEYIVKIFAYGFEGRVLSNAIMFTKISSFSVLFLGLIAIFLNYLHYKKSFLAGAFIGVPLNVVVILSIYFSKGNIVVLPVGFAVGVLIQLVILSICARRKGYKYQYNFDIRNKYIIKIYKMFIPLAVSTMIYQLHLLVDRTIASSIAVGGISVLNYADRINGFITSVFVVSIVSVLFPRIVEFALKLDFVLLKRLIEKVIISILLITIPSVLGIVLFSDEIITVIYGRGEFDIIAIKLTSSVLIYYSLGMIAASLNLVFYKVFYSLENTKTPVIIASISLLINIILNITLSKYFGLNGLAVSTSIASVFSTIAMFIALRNKIGMTISMNVFTTTIKIVLSSAVMGMLTTQLHSKLILGTRYSFALIYSIVFGVLIYGLLLQFMRIQEVSDARKVVLAKLKFYLSKF